MLVDYKVLNIINALSDTLGSILTLLCLLLSYMMMPGEKVFHRVRKRASKGLGCVRHREYLFFHWCGSRSAPGSCSLACFDGFHSLEILIVDVSPHQIEGCSTYGRYMSLEILFAKISAHQPSPCPGTRWLHVPRVFWPLCAAFCWGPRSRLHHSPQTIP